MIQTPWSSKDKNSLVPKGRSFVKMHGLKNDFIIVDARERPFNPSIEKIKLMLHRNEGIGADTLVVIEPPKLDSNTCAFVRFLDVGGNEGQACGNASRCVGWLLMKENHRNSVKFQTLGGLINCRLVSEKTVSVEMGKLKTKWNEIPISKEMDTLHLGIGAGPLQDPVGMNIGNPHAVFFVNDLTKIDFIGYGDKLVNHPLFPQTTNVGAAEIVDDFTMKLLVYERPGILTKACGSGSCSAVGAAIRRGLTSSRTMKVINSGGIMEITITPENEALMIGPVEICFSGFLLE